MQSPIFAYNEQQTQDRWSLQNKQMLRVALANVWIGGVAAATISVVGQLLDCTRQQRQAGLTGLPAQHQSALQCGPVLVPVLAVGLGEYRPAREQAVELRPRREQHRGPLVVLLVVIHRIVQCIQQPVREAILIIVRQVKVAA